METTVKIKAIPRLSRIVGWSPKSGKIVNCMMIAKINPDPTSIKLSIRLLIVTFQPYQIPKTNT